jgi:hypothetical protein
MSGSDGRSSDDVRQPCHVPLTAFLPIYVVGGDGLEPPTLSV